VSNPLFRVESRFSKNTEMVWGARGPSLETGVVLPDHRSSSSSRGADWMSVMGVRKICDEKGLASDCGSGKGGLTRLENPARRVAPAGGTLLESVQTSNISD
jgi:hypothetical protein